MQFRAYNIFMDLRILSIFICAMLSLSACTNQESLPVIQLSESEGNTNTEYTEPLHLPLRVAVAAVISPRATLDAYGPLLDYLSEQLDRPVQLVQRGTYAEINDLVRAGAVDLAFVCGGAYVEGTRDFGMELLVAPQVNGETLYYSYIIVPSDSPYISLSELQGKSFAFSDPLSNSGHLALQWVLNQQGETPETFFKKTIFTYSHDNSIQSVINHLVDGAAVDSLVYDAIAAQDPSIAAKMRIIQRIGPFGIPPVVVHPNIDPVLREALRTALLNMDSDPQGEQILASLNIQRFVEINDSAYASIREMAAILRNWNDAP